MRVCVWSEGRDIVCDCYSKRRTCVYHHVWRDIVCAVKVLKSMWVWDKLCVCYFGRRDNARRGLDKVFLFLRWCFNPADPFTSTDNANNLRHTTHRPTDAQINKHTVFYFFCVFIVPTSDTNQLYITILCASEIASYISDCTHKLTETQTHT